MKGDKGKRGMAFFNRKYYNSDGIYNRRIETNLAIT